MDWTQIKNFGLKRVVISAFLVAGMAFTGRNAIETSREAQRITVLNDGIQTCFVRVHQSFTARMLGDLGSEYLTQGFQENTGRCFGEALNLMEAQSAAVFGATTKTLNTLATEVHVFHDRVSPKGSAFSQNPNQVVLSNISSRFEKLEALRDQVYDAIERRRTELVDTQATLRGAFYVLTFSLLIFFALEISLLSKEAKEKAAIELEAEVLLTKNDMSSLRVQEVLRKALEQKDYKNCSQLFTQFHFYKTNIKNDAAAYEQYRTFTPLKATNEELIEQVWGASERLESDLVVYDDMFRPEVEKKILAKNQTLIPGLKGLNLDQSVSRLIDHLGQKFFTKGLRVEVEIDEAIYVQGQDEAFEQMFFQSLSLLVDENTQEGAYLTISARKLGNVVILECEVDGSGFEESLIKGQIGYRSFNDDQRPLEMRICEEMAQEIHAKLSFDNLYDDQGTIAGRSIKMTLKEGSAETSKRIQQLGKGTKKEILERLNQTAES